MLIREVLLLLQCCWPSLLLHWTLHPIWGFIQITHGEPQKTCSKPVAAKVTDSCQQICQCRPPPLPPPPPPPPPPRLLGVPSPTAPVCPAPESWWPGPVIIIAACCTTPVFLFLVFIICYKAIKSTPPVSAGDTCQDPPWIPETVDNSETYILTIIELEACRKIAVENVESPTNTPGREYFLELGKPLRKEENGTSRAEYAMTSSQNSKTVESNNAVV